jgi:hypothetical protein
LAEKLGFLRAEAYESKFANDDYRLYGTGHRIDQNTSERVLESMPPHVTVSINNAIRRWYDDTFDLLNYVYFHTGPMKAVKPGQVLSFDNEAIPDYQSLRSVNMLPLSAKKRKALREEIGKLKEENPEMPSRTDIFDDEYFAFMSRLAGSETPVGLKGVARLTFEDPLDD